MPSELSRPDLSLIVPTYNEGDGIAQLLERTAGVLSQAGIDAELLVVDDNSPDGTADLVEQLGERLPVRVLRRPGKLGLASAVIDGWTRARGSLLGVMDADGSHDPSILPAMVEAVLADRCEVAVGSRYIPGGGMGDWPWFRQLISRVAVALGSFICPVKDVTSGFLVLRRSVVENVALDPIGFKIGLEVLVRGHYTRFCEVPYVFKDRERGSSKLNLREVRNYLIHLARLVAHWAARRPVRQRV